MWSWVWNERVGWRVGGDGGSCHKQGRDGEGLEPSWPGAVHTLRLFPRGRPLLLCPSPTGWRTQKKQKEGNKYKRQKGWWYMEEVEGREVKTPVSSEGVPQDPAGCPPQRAQKKQETDRWQRHETDRWDSKATGSWPISCDALRPGTPPPPRPSFGSKLPGGHQPSLAHLCFGTSRPGLTEGMGQLHAPQGHSSQRPGPWATMTQPDTASMLHNAGQAAPARHACYPPPALPPPPPFLLVLSSSLGIIPIPIAQ